MPEVRFGAVQRSKIGSATRASDIVVLWAVLTWSAQPVLEVSLWGMPAFQSRLSYLSGFDRWPAWWRLSIDVGAGVGLVAPFVIGVGGALAGLRASRVLIAVGSCHLLAAAVRVPAVLMASAHKFASTSSGASALGAPTAEVLMRMGQELYYAAVPIALCLLRPWWALVTLKSLVVRTCLVIAPLLVVTDLVPRVLLWRQWVESPYTSPANSVMQSCVRTVGYAASLARPIMLVGIIFAARQKVRDAVRAALAFESLCALCAAVILVDVVACRGLSVATRVSVQEAYGLYATCMLPTTVVWSSALGRRRNGPADDEPHCSLCGYSLRGNRSGACPECGTPIVKHVG